MAAEVLIAGAGPTGLVLAIWLSRLGVSVRIIDKAAGPGTSSRALVVQARTLELYQQLGLARTLVEGGLEFAGINVWVRGKKRGRAEVGQIGRGLSSFPYMLIYPQDEHERTLIARLEEGGVRIERGVELLGVDNVEGAARAILRHSDGTQETCEAAWLAGCDGAHSAVRRALGTGFPGGVYSQLFYVADVEADGEPIDGELHISFDGADFLGVFPLKGKGRARLIGTLRERSDHPDDLGWDDIHNSAVGAMHIEVRRVNWLSTYRVHHRVSERFRVRRSFLLGDAAHIHSPVGGQGMNTGIGDAVNLSWKLAMVIQGQAETRILDTYEAERMAFARRLVATTDRIFTLVTRPGRLADSGRTVVPVVLATLLRLSDLRRYVFRNVSQIAIEYGGSALSEGRAGDVRGGDRLPWVQSEDGTESNFAPLASLRWQVHVYGEASAALSKSCAARGLPLHVMPFGRGTERAGVMRNALYLVRPDGYVALADGSGAPAGLERFLASRGLHPAAGQQPPGRMPDFRVFI